MFPFNVSPTQNGCGTPVFIARISGSSIFFLAVVGVCGDKRLLWTEKEQANDTRRDLFLKERKSWPRDVHYAFLHASTVSETERRE